MLKSLMVVVMSLLLGVGTAQAERIKELTSISGIRPNQLIGYGLVVGLNGTGDVYVRVNEYEALIKRNTDVEVPLPVYQMLINAIETKGQQNKDGSLTFRDVPSYNVTYLGEVE